MCLSFKKCIFCLRRHKIPTSRRDLERKTDIVIIDMDQPDQLLVHESCIVEGDRFVGCTAQFNDNGEIIPLRPDLHPRKYLPFHLPEITQVLILNLNPAQISWLRRRNRPVSLSYSPVPSLMGVL